MSTDEKTIVQFKNSSGQIQSSRPIAGGFARPTPGGKVGSRPVPPPPPAFAPPQAFSPQSFAEFPCGLQSTAAVVSRLDNPLLGAGRELIDAMAQLGSQAEPRDVIPFRDWACQQIQAFEHTCMQLEVNEEKRFYARYVLCTVLDELVIKTSWGGDGVWTRQSLLSQFHGETSGGERFFQLLEYLQQAPAKNIHLLELMYICMGLGFEGKYRLNQRGYAELEGLRDNLFHLLRMQKGEPERDLSPHWQRAIQQRNRLARYFPLWVVAAVVGVIMLATYSGFSYLLAEKNQHLVSRLERSEPAADSHSR